MIFQCALALQLAAFGTQFNGFPGTEISTKDSIGLLGAATDVCVHEIGVAGPADNPGATTAGDALVKGSTGQQTNLVLHRRGTG